MYCTVYLSSRAARVRNLAVAFVNGAVTLVILLIAPLGLAAVIINTLLVTIATYFTATAADRVVGYLNPSMQQAERLGRSSQSQIRRYDNDDLDRR